MLYENEVCELVGLLKFGQSQSVKIGIITVDASSLSMDVVAVRYFGSNYCVC